MIIKKCEVCGKEFKVSQSEINRGGGRGKYCSKQCYWNKTGGQVILNCKKCGKEFKVRQYRKNIYKYCSKECRSKTIIKICPECEKEFKTNQSILSTGRDKFCSLNCYRKVQRKHIYMEDITGKKFERLTAIKFDHCQGSNYYWLFRCDCGKEKIIVANSIKSGLVKSCGCFNFSYHKTIRDEKNSSWKGDDVGYSGLHSWMRLRLGAPKKCEICGKDNLTGRQIHWHNRDHQYKRNLIDWVRLCSSCHTKANNTLKNHQLLTNNKQFI